ncbi:thiamine phosphate phosphatase-like protein isoform X2 [Cryptomeria japonica]|uniref:thiamine phosphate phosphatase-like protein isoform X2 n=1 Tax=Cryptomeria japonica TaxID=3369 RepID=UPI0025ACB19E|nr:thiamine phosphate phosphatase-like protein isoform X2 [Cryptomeria japonica]
MANWTSFSSGSCSKTSSRWLQFVNLGNNRTPVMKLEDLRFRKCKRNENGVDKPLLKRSISSYYEERPILKKEAATFHQRSKSVKEDKRAVETRRTKGFRILTPFTSLNSCKSSINSELLSMDTVVVFDFDLTIIDCDSDPWVMKQLGVTELFESLLPTLPWNTVMDKMMGELHEQGKTISDIEASLRTIPLYPDIIRAIKFAFSLGCDLRIVSDANLFFIKTILETHDLLQYFTEIKTNPAFVEKSGRLRICPFHPFTVAPHGCNLCPPNMCKGAVIDEMRKSIEDGFNKRFIYLGDGSGDFCPTLKLTEGDDVLPRKEYPLWKLIEKNPSMVKAKVHGWSNAKDVEDLLMKLLMP